MAKLRRPAKRQAERKRAGDSASGSDKQFRMLVEGALDYAMFLLDCDNRILFWSRGAEQLFGWSRKEALGQNATMIFTPEDRAAGVVERETQTALRKGSAVDQRWHVRRDGSRFWADGRLMLVSKTAVGRECRLAKIARDATAEREAKEGLIRARSELERRVEERTAAFFAAHLELQNEINERRRLEGEILLISEREKRRIGQDLHDGLCQQLAATALLLQSLANKDSRNPEVASALHEAAQRVNANVDVARDLARGLYPVELGTASLMSALRELSFRKSDDGIVRFDCPSPVRIRDQNVALNLYRIAQEAVNNATKYARAREIVISLRRNSDGVLLSVRDDGKGIRNRSKKGMGIHIMTYRANVIGGKLSIASKPGNGTSVTCLLMRKNQNNRKPELDGTAS
jgi:PAS domain S-box-containing protein